MATVTKDDIAVKYPLPVYSYRVEIDGLAVAFSEVSGLNVAFETTTYKESLYDGQAQASPNVMYMPSQMSAVNITLKKGMISNGDDGTDATVLYSWLNETALNKITKKDIDVHLCDEAGAPVISWKVLKAFPTKLDMPTLDANSNDVAIESMELMADRVLMSQS